MAQARVVYLQIWLMQLTEYKQQEAYSRTLVETVSVSLSFSVYIFVFAFNRVPKALQVYVCLDCKEMFNLFGNS